MKLLLTFLFAVIAIGLTCGLANSQTATQPDRQIGITIDDLPAGAANSMSAAAITEMTTTIRRIGECLFTIKKPLRQYPLCSARFTRMAWLCSKRSE